MKHAHLLRQARERRGWSQAKVAQLLETASKNIGRWERGETFPSAYFRERLCRLFEVDAEALGLLATRSASTSASTSPPIDGPELLFDPTRPRLMVPSTQIVGRQDLLTEVLDTLETATSCVLYGIPGVGKTTLAQLVSIHPRCTEFFSDGVLWVNLGPSPNLLSILLRLANLLGISKREQKSLQRVDDWSRMLHQAVGERRLLIVIDDAWKVEAVLPFLFGGSHTTHLVTTRLPEVALALPSCAPVPVPELDMEQSRLLFNTLTPQLPEKEDDAVQRLLTLTGGLPLAVTLIGHYARIQTVGGQRRRMNAAVAHLSDAQVHLHLVTPYGPTTHGAGSHTGTHWSLENIIGLSDHALPSHAQQALRALSVLPAKPDSFSEATALAICEQEVEVLDCLLDAGLLEGASEGRYRFHQTIAAYGRMYLQDQKPWNNLVQHALSLSETARMDHGLLEQEHTTLLAALDATIAHGWKEEYVQLTSRLRRFWLIEGHHVLARKHVAAALPLLQQLGDSREEGLMRHKLGVLADMQSHVEEAQRLFEEGLVFARSFATPDAHLEGAFLNSLGVVTVKQGKFRQARVAYEEALHLARRSERRNEMSISLGNIGAVALYQGQVQEARACFLEGLSLVDATNAPQRTQLWVHLGSLALFIGHDDEALTAYRHAQAEAGGPLIECQIGLGLGSLARRSHDWKDAERWLLKGQSLADEIGLEELRIEALASRAELAQEQGRLEEAESLLRAALADAQRLGFRMGMALVQTHLGTVCLAQRRAGEAAHLFALAASQLCEEEAALQAEIVYGQAQVAATQGRWQDAERLGERCLTHFAAMSHWKTTLVREWRERLPSLASLPNQGVSS